MYVPVNTPQYRINDMGVDKLYEGSTRGLGLLVHAHSSELFKPIFYNG